MTDGVRYGIVGTGMGVEHIHDLTALDGARVTALADPYEPSLVAAMQALVEGVETFADHRQLLDSCACDAVVVATVTT